MTARFKAQGLARGEVSAEAVTTDLRAPECKLSLWRCGEGKDSEIEDVVIAIATANPQPSRVDIVLIEEDDIRQDGLEIANRAGVTRLENFADQHVDVCRLDYIRLGAVARRVEEAVRSNRWKRFTKPEVKELVRVAEKAGRVRAV